MEAVITAVFVYGTLKRDGLRGKLWPIPPQSIEQATIEANLYDVGPYPAIGWGSDWVLGELWTFLPDEMGRTLEVLDRVEGYEALGANNEYVREPTTARLIDGSTRACYVYRFSAVEHLAKLRRIPPHAYFGDRPCAAWPDADARVPRTFEEE